MCGVESWVGVSDMTRRWVDFVVGCLCIVSVGTEIQFCWFAFKVISVLKL